MNSWSEPMKLYFSCWVRFRIGNWTKPMPETDFDQFCPQTLGVIFHESYLRRSFSWSSRLLSLSVRKGARTHRCHLRLLGVFFSSWFWGAFQKGFGAVLVVSGDPNWSQNMRNIVPRGFLGPLLGHSVFVWQKKYSWEGFGGYFWSFMTHANLGLPLAKLSL